MQRQDKLLIIMLILSVSLTSADYVLDTNLTFEGDNINNYNVTGTWSIASSGCKSGSNCLSLDSSGADAFAIIKVGKFLDFETTKVVIRYWTDLTFANDLGYGSIIPNWQATNLWDAPIVTNREDIAFIARQQWYNHGATRSISNLGTEEVYKPIGWVFLELNLTRYNATLVMYSNASTNRIYAGINTSVAFHDFNGYLGFFGYRTYKIDDVQIFTYSAPAPPSGDTPVVNIPSYNFEIGTNLTDGNFTNNPINWSISITSNYNITVPDYFARWSFNNSATNLTEDRLIHNLTASGVTTEDASKYGGGFHFDGANDYLNTTWYGGNSWGTNALTVTAWVNSSGLNNSGYQSVVSQSETSLSSGDGFYLYLYEDSGIKVQGGAGDNSGANFDLSGSSTTLTQDVWHFIALSYDLGKCPNIYIDGVNVTTCTQNDGVTNYNASYPLTIGSNADREFYLNGSIDEVRIYNRSLSSLEIYELYTKTKPNYDCTLYANGSQVSTYNNLLKGQTKTIDWNTSGLEGGYALNLTCTDYFLYNSNVTTDTFIDTGLPSVTLSAGNLINNTVYYYDLKTPNLFNTTVWCNDVNLFSCNVTLWELNSTGAKIFRHNNTERTNIVSENSYLNTTLNIESINASRYMFYIESYDSHTANTVRPVQWFTTNNVIHIDNNITLEGDIKEELTEFILANTGDKYKFKITWQDDTLIHYLNITAVGDLTYRATDGYLGHFVYLPQRRWLDFNSPNVKDVTVTDYGNNKYGLAIEHYTATDEVEFNSIGDLNQFYAAYYFNVTDGFTITAKDFITNTSISNYTILIYTGTTLLQNRSTTGGNLTFNITSGSFGVNISSPNYVNNRTDAVAFLSGGSYNFYLSAANSLYLLVYDEQTNQYIDDRTVTIDVINYLNVSNRYTTTDGTKFISGFAAGEYEINYYAPDYPVRSYYTTISGSDTQQIKLFLLNSTEGAYNNYEVVDESATALRNATIKMQKYFIADNAWQTVEMSKSNDAGEGFFFVERYDTSYRFVIEYLGATVKTTQQTKLDTRTLYLKVSLTSTGLQSYFDLGDATTTLSFSNETDIWTFSYNSPSAAVSKANLVIVKKTNFGDTIISNTSLAADSGAITYNQSAYNDEEGTFIAYGFLTTTADAVSHLVQVASYSYTKTYQYLGMNGVLLAFLVIGTLAFVGVWSPSAAIVFALFGLIISVSIGLIYVSYPIIIGVIIAGVVVIAKLKV